MQFNEVIGREAVKSHLRELVQHNRLSHALLFLGSEGSGALPMALAFAQFILCERVHPSDKNKQQAPSLFGAKEPEPEPQSSVLRSDSCGVCQACIKTERNIHPDLHFSYPTLKRNSKHKEVLSTDYANEWRVFLKENPYGSVTDWLDFLGSSATAKIESAANKQGNITSFECEDIARKLSLRPFESDYKILLLWMPEYLGKEGNRLLKLIEEPPDGTIFILVAEDESKILPTILSRTQLIKIPLPADKEVEEYLISRGASQQQAAQTAAVAEGNVSEALRALSSQEEDRQKVIRNWLNAIFQNSVGQQAEWLEKIGAAGREKQKLLLRYFLHLIEISLRLNALNEEEVKVLDSSEIDFGNILNKMAGVEVLGAMASEIDKALYYIERNANSKLLFHALTIRFFHLIKKKQLILVH